MSNKEDLKCFVTIHQVCGDCGKEIIEKIEIPNEDDKKYQEKFHYIVIKCYGTKANMACSECSKKL